MFPAAWSGFTDARKGRLRMAWKRYKDPESGAEFTADERAGTAMGLKPIGDEAVDVYGRPIQSQDTTTKGGQKSASDK
jgi:hypothetical protein